MQVLKPLSLPRAALLAAAVLVLGGCESMSTSMGKKIDYKSTSTAPALELPPDLRAPQYDERYNLATASAVAATTNAAKPKTADQIAPNQTANARIVRSGTDRWLVVKATPEQVWNTIYRFWIDLGFAIAVDQPLVGLMETDWAENRADLPVDAVRQLLGRFSEILYTTYRRDKFRTRVERGSEPGTIDIFVTHRGAEQMPTAMSASSPVAFAWAVMPPNPGLETEVLTRMMVRFGAEENVARSEVTQAMAPAGAAGAAAAEPVRLVKAADGTSVLDIDDSFSRSWRRVGLALDRIGFTVVDRDRAKGIYYVRYADPDTAKVEPSWWSKLQFWKDSTTEKPEQYQVVVAGDETKSTVAVRGTDGGPDRSANGEKILSLIRSQL
jgi:outer membrane protein assembly factor BamC